MKYLPALLAINSLLALGLQPQIASATTLYNGSGLPEEQGWIAPGAVGSNGLPIATFNVTPGTDGVTVQTDNIDSSSGATATSGYLGYSNYTASPNTATPDPFDAELNLINPAFPVLNADDGYSIFFDVAVDPVPETDPNRASFSLLVVSSDKTKSIELDFEADLVFAQSDADNGSGLSEFTRAETSTPIDTSIIRSYELKADSSTYELLADNTSILTGNLRDYEFDADNSEPSLPFDPYETPNFLFFGDLTDQAAGSFTLGEVRVENAIASTPEFSPVFTITLLGIGMGVQKLAQKNLL